MLHTCHLADVSSCLSRFIQVITVSRQASTRDARQIRGKSCLRFYVNQHLSSWSITSFEKRRLKVGICARRARQKYDRQIKNKERPGKEANHTTNKSSSRHYYDYKLKNKLVQLFMNETDRGSASLSLKLSQKTERFDASVSNCPHITAGWINYRTLLSL